ncbi:MAG TPA: gephyrin-like molybdotransferase Glp [Caulobacteraceae bacterium]|jgi:molybdopterin molybdotransferase|nr:gephyrin-like molybdotransferase Glp [Caulobacteraceae bacterium]
MPLASVEEARARILALATTMPAETVTLADAVGRTLAEDIHAMRDQPPYPASAMDGWGLAAADTPGRLRIAGESAAGRPYEAPLARGEAVRIFTGAALPTGADTIVIQENATRDGGMVEVPVAAVGDWVRPAGCDFRAGERLLTRGQRLDAWRLSLAAAGGRGQLTAARRPRVSFLSTGEEIVDPGAAAGPYQIFDAATVALVALARQWGGEATRLRPVRDDRAATVAAVRGADCDLVVTVGGASVGDHDLVKPALAELGLELAVEGVNVRPGRPTWFGALADGRRVLGLPGNPASALVCAELFLRPLLAAMQGGDPALPMLWARAAAPFPRNGPREHWMRARITATPDGSLSAEAFPDQDSSLVSVFAGADALVRRPPLAEALPVGAPVEVLLLARA